MDEEYNKITANHYVAYRPPLHEMILKGCILEDEKFTSGLDIGCGTGVSSIGLAKYCSHVYGIEPSEEMLNKAVPQNKITYLKGSGNLLPVPDKSIDVVTFAGSLFYAKSPGLIKELKRVCHEKSLLIPYDFKILFDEALHHFNLDMARSSSNYNHEINFDDINDFNKITSRKEQIDFAISSKNLAQILLSDSNVHALFVLKYNLPDPSGLVIENLEKITEQWILKVNIYFSKYQIGEIAFK